MGAIESSGGGGIDNAFTGAFLLELAERKLRLFPDDPGVVLSWNIKEIHDGFHVTVEAGLPAGFGVNPPEPWGERPSA